MADQELRQKWLEALRSGRYKQAQGALHVEDGYCCLGVLCDISGEGNWSGVVWVASDGTRKVLDLPRSIEDRVEITPRESGRLADMNDGTGVYKGEPHTFTEIADYLETKVFANG